MFAGIAARIISPPNIRAKACSTARLLVVILTISDSSVDEAEVLALLRRRKDEKTDVLPGSGSGVDVAASGSTLLE